LSKGGTYDIFKGSSQEDVQSIHETTLYNTFPLGSESSLFKLTRRMVRALKKARFPTTTFEGGNKQRIGD
jgi:hypothetical protein